MDSYYPEKVRERFGSPKNIGKAANANAVGTGASFVCGSFARFSLLIDTASKEIEKAGFVTNGCGFMIAAADCLSDHITSKRLTELHGLGDGDLRCVIELELGKFPSSRITCLETCAEALHAAFSDFRTAQIEEFRGEAALICTCFGVSEETIEACIRENKLSLVEEVADICNAGSGCGSCQFLVQEIIDSRNI